MLAGYCRDRRAVSSCRHPSSAGWLFYTMPWWLAVSRWPTMLLDVVWRLCLHPDTSSLRSVSSRTVLFFLPTSPALQTPLDAGCRYRCHTQHGLCVCLCVVYDREPCKMAEPIGMLSEGQTSEAPRSYVIYRIIGVLREVTLKRKSCTKMKCFMTRK